MNSDACERLFTIRIADLLDEHVPGSKGTSLYIRAVYYLIQPFRVPDFGSPAEVQKSVSCAITVFRLWKKVLELRKLCLHSRPGAKTDPAKRGKFITYGCHRTAEILFAAATIHQLTMFLHFKDLGPGWASPYSSGTKTTERIIGEMQGKTTEIQNLDSQPTFGNMLEKCSKVQFNLNAKQRLASAGANVKAFSKRKNMAYAFKERKYISDYEYPNDYQSFRAAQIRAHKEGVKEGQTLFAKYLPQECVQQLKETGNWDVPYKFSKPTGYKVVDGPPPKDFDRLTRSFTYASLEDLESQCQDKSDEAELNVNCQEDTIADNVDDDNDHGGKDETNADEEMGDTEQGGRKWKVSRYSNGSLSYIHIKRALKLLLPREYISRSRQRRHWASRYLPGKEPVDQKHDIFKYCDIALRVTQDGQSKYQIGRVEAIESTKEGCELTSFQLKSKTSVRIRCSLYARDENDAYFIPEDVLLTNWKAQSSIIGNVDLQPVPGKRGIYTLHQTSKETLLSLGIFPYDVSVPHSVADDDSLGCASSGLEEEFFEVEEVLERRLSKDGLCYEYKVRFKGYGPEDDMWLPASFFNRPIQFESISKSGRKRRHTVDPENVIESSKKSRRSENGHNKPKVSVSSNKIKRAKEVKTKSKSTKSAAPEEQQMSTSRNNTRKSLRKRNRSRVCKDKGKRFRSSLEKTSSLFSDKEPESTARESDTKHGNTDPTKRGKEKKEWQCKAEDFPERPYCKGNTSAESSQALPTNTMPNLSSDSSHFAKATNSTVLTVDDVCEDSDAKLGSDILADVLRSNDNFCSPRRLLSEAIYPEVDRNLTSYKLVNSGIDLTNPITVTRLPPQSVLLEIENNSNKTNSSSVAFQFPFYGTFDREGIRVLGRFHLMKSLRKQVQFEKTWLKKAFENLKYQQEVTDALLDRWNKDERFLACHGNYQITSQTLSLLAGERYLSDEIINFLIQKYCDKANETSEKNGVLILLPSFLSTGTVLRNVVQRLSLLNDMERVKYMFLPVHMNESHWGLAVFSAEEKIVYFDYRYHCPIPEQLIRNSTEILRIINETTNNATYHPLMWKGVTRFKVPMPDQPRQCIKGKHGTGSCGVAVICAARDFCNGVFDDFSWTYEDAPRLRAELMVEILDLH